MKQKIIWFIAGVATAAQVKKAKESGYTIRNSEAVVDGDFIEACDGVLGDVPKSYEHKAIKEPKAKKDGDKPTEEQKKD